MSKSTKMIRSRRCGLRNMGNTCYVNTAIQCIANVNELSDYLCSEDNSSNYLGDINRDVNESRITFEFSNLLKKMFTTDRPIVPDSFIERLSEFNKHSTHQFKFVLGRQHDIQEFLIFLLDVIHISIQEEVTIEFKGKPKNKTDDLLLDSYKSWKRSIEKEYSTMIELFSGQYLLEIYSDTPDNKLLSMNFDRFNYLSLEITGNSIYDCLDNHCAFERLNGDNQYEYENGDIKVKMDAKKRFTFWKLPKYLIVSFKRFKFHHTGRKINDHIDFPINNLDMSPYASGLATGNSSYRLISIANHMGGSGGGHYFAITRTPSSGSKWVLYNDRSVVDIDYDDMDELKSKIVTKNAYLLIYEKY